MLKERRERNTYLAGLLNDALPMETQNQNHVICETKKRSLKWTMAGTQLVALGSAPLPFVVCWCCYPATGTYCEPQNRAQPRFPPLVSRSKCKHNCSPNIAILLKIFNSFSDNA